MYVKKLFRAIKDKLAQVKKPNWQDNLDISQRQEQLKKVPLSPDLESNLGQIEELTGASPDINIRRFAIAGNLPAAVIYVDGLCDESEIDSKLHTLMVETVKNENIAAVSEDTQAMLDSLITAGETDTVDDLASVFKSVSAGESCLMLDGHSTAMVCEMRGRESREITEPNTEVAIRGPRDGFVEDLRTNTAILRFRIRVPHLWFEEFEIGELTQTSVGMGYIKGLVQNELVDEVRSRLERIKTDSILESGYIEDFIQDQPFTPFPLVLRTERPDRVAACLLEGRIAIITQGSPFVLVVPAELPMMLQAPDDYYETFPAGNFMRLIRFFGALASLLLPGLYVAVINFHHALLPTNLAMRITAAREGIPFPVVVEVLLLEFLFELLREAGLRLPAPIGEAVSIVGALILGDAAIRAGLVSPAVVIVVALTAIASFSMPIFSLGIALRILRFALVGLGAVLGLFGIQFGLLLLLIHLCALRSFGVPYLAPMAPFIWPDMKDNLIRVWNWAMKDRPRFTGQREPVRTESGLKPGVDQPSPEDSKGGGQQ